MRMYYPMASQTLKKTILTYVMVTFCLALSVNFTIQLDIDHDS